MTCKDAASLCRVSWETMKEIDKRNLKKQFSNPPLKGVTKIAIDEIAVKKGHKYVSLVFDPKSRRGLLRGILGTFEVSQNSNRMGDYRLSTRELS